MRFEQICVSVENTGRPVLTRRKSRRDGPEGASPGVGLKHNLKRRPKKKKQKRADPWTAEGTRWLIRVWGDAGAPFKPSSRCCCCNYMTSHITRNAGRRLCSHVVATATGQAGQ